MKTIYVAIDGIADGPMEIEEDAELLKAVQKKYPQALRAVPKEADSNVIIVSTTDDRA